MRPQGAPRQALEKLIHSGHADTCEGFAVQAGLAVDKVRKTITSMRNAGLVVARSSAVKGAMAKKGRPRVIYALSTRATREAHVRELDRILATWGGGVVQPDGVEE